MFDYLPLQKLQTAVIATVTAIGLSLGATATASAQDNNRLLEFLDPEDTVILMVDHQTGLLQTVRDNDPTQLRANVQALAMAATEAGIPVIATSSVASGPNGPLIPEIAEHAPGATVIDRSGQINAMDSAEFRAAVEATGRNTVVIAGILTSVCVAFPSLTLLSEGYDVIAVADASGDHSALASQATIARLSAAGVKVEGTFSVLSQIHGAWTEENAPTWAGIYSEVAPNYAAVLESYFGQPTN